MLLHSEFELRLEKLEKKLSTQQSTIDTLTTQVNTISAALAAVKTQYDTDISAIQAEVTALQAQLAAGQTLDFSKLQAAVEAAQTNATALTSDAAGQAPPVQPVTPPAGS